MLKQDSIVDKKRVCEKIIKEIDENLTRIEKDISGTDKSKFISTLFEECRKNALATLGSVQASETMQALEAGIFDH